MSSIKIDITNFLEIKKQLADIPKDIEKQVIAELKGFGVDTVRDAITLAPTDEGHLRSSISYKVEGTEVEIIVATDYAAYLEFGTRSFADQYVSTLPPDWQTFAATFKGGGGGSLEEMLLRIMEWVRRKGIAGTYSVKTHKRTKASGSNHHFEDAEAAYPIALSILRKGIRAHPFLYPSVVKNREILITNLKKLLE